MLQSSNAHIYSPFFPRDLTIWGTLPRRRRFRVKCAGIPGQMSAPVSTHLGPQWQALSTARSVWGRALSTSCVKQWPVVSPPTPGAAATRWCRTTGPGTSPSRPHLQGRAEGGGEVSSRRRGNPRSQGPSSAWEPHPSGRDAPTRKRGGARVTARTLTSLSPPQPAHDPPPPLLPERAFPLASSPESDGPSSSCVTPQQ